MKTTIRTMIGAALLTATPLIAFAGAGGGTSTVTDPVTDVLPGSASPVPEPGALLLFAAGAVVVGAAIRRSRR